MLRPRARLGRAALILAVLSTPVTTYVAHASTNPGAPVVATTVQLGTTGADNANGVDTYRGTTYVVGATSGSLEGANAGSYDAFLTELSTVSGAHLNGKQVGTTSDDSLSGVDAGPWGVVVGGTTGGDLAGTGVPSDGSHDAFVRAYDPAGMLLWTTEWRHQGYDSISAVRVVHGVVYAVGMAGGTAVRGLVMKLDLATGDLLGKPRQLGDGVTNTHLFGLTVVGSDPVVAGFTAATDNGRKASQYVARLKGSTLTTRWSWQRPGRRDTEILGVTAAGSRVYVAGTYYDKSDTYSASVGSLDAATGRQLWMRSGADWTYASAVTATADGPVATGSEYHNQAIPAQGLEATVEGFTSSGKRLWHASFGATPVNTVTSGQGITVTPAGGLVVVGETQALLGAAQFGGMDAFVRLFHVHRPVLGVRVGKGAWGDRATLTVRRKHTAQAMAKLSNTGDVSDDITMTGCTSPAEVALTIRQGSTVVTGGVQTGAYHVVLAPGKSLTYTVTAKAGGTAPLKSSRCTFRSHAVGDRDATSTATLVIAVTK